MRLSKNRSFQQLGTAALFLLPGLALFVVFVILPMLYSFRISFYDWNIVRPELSEWEGLQNYIQALQDPIFRRAVLNTLAYTLVTVPGQMILGLFVALLLNQNIRGKSLFRVLYYLPVITSWVIVSLLFEYMFSGQAGLVNYVLRDVLHVIDKNILWLADPVLAFVPIHLLGIWKGIGWTAIIFLAGLQAIPDHDGLSGRDIPLRKGKFERTRMRFAIIACGRREYKIEQLPDSEAFNQFLYVFVVAGVR